MQVVKLNIIRGLPHIMSLVKGGSKGHQSLILQPLLENNINQKMGTSCLHPKSIYKNFCKYCAKICEKNCVEILQTAYFAKKFAIQTM